MKIERYIEIDNDSDIITIHDTIDQKHIHSMYLDFKNKNDSHYINGMLT